MKKTILAITGKRGGYEAMLPLLTSLEKDDRLNVCLLALDQHYMKKFGRTHDKMDFPHVGMPPVAEGDSKRDRCANLGSYVNAVSYHLTTHRPDLLLLYGDRGEVAAAALAAATMRVPVAHLQAGDTTGGVDDIYRGMISQTANLLFTSCNTYGDDLVRKGHSLGRIFVTGDQHLDAVKRRLLLSKKEVCELLMLKEKAAIGIIIVHPDDDIQNQIDDILKACLSYTMMQWFAIYPCSDPGHQTIIDALHKHERGASNLIVQTSLTSDVFQCLLSHAELIVGNSSCGIIEAPFLETPSLDIRYRQEGRVKGLGVHSIPTGKYLKVVDGIAACIKYDGLYHKDFGEGNAYIEIGEIILDSLFGHLGYLLEPKMNYNL